jgi:uncharacterized protein (DUF2141 family)
MLQIPFLLFLFVSAYQSPALVLRIQGISGNKGALLVAVFNKANGFPSGSEGAVKRLRVNAQSGSQDISITDLPPGRYAVAVFHDANNDGKLNTNALGIPKEAYGFSNNARPRFRSPDFDEAAFDFNGSSRFTISIR